MDNYMRILIDADACPVYRIAEKIAKENYLPVILFSDSMTVFKANFMAGSITWHLAIFFVGRL